MTALGSRLKTLIIYRDEASLNCRSSGLGTVRDFPLLDHAVDMILYCILTDSQRMADLLVGRSLGEQLEDFNLARGKIGPHHALREAGSYVARDIFFPCMYSADRFHHLLQASVFQQITLRTGLHRTIDVFVRLKAGQDDDPGVVSSASQGE